SNAFEDANDSGAETAAFEPTNDASAEPSALEFDTGEFDSAIASLEGAVQDFDADVDTASEDSTKPLTDDETETK
ncbi:MAG: hypothetical protein ACXVDE_04855, partial [Tumebacillaceae bacterium]